MLTDKPLFDTIAFYISSTTVHPINSPALSLSVAINISEFSIYY